MNLDHRSRVPILGMTVVVAPTAAKAPLTVRLGLALRARSER
jgi:hypothetical protein